MPLIWQLGYAETPHCKDVKPHCQYMQSSCTIISSLPDRLMDVVNRCNKSDTFEALMQSLEEDYEEIAREMRSALSETRRSR